MNPTAPGVKAPPSRLLGESSGSVEEPQRGSSTDIAPSRQPIVGGYRPLLRLWGPVLFKGLTGVVALACVAMLGTQSDPSGVRLVAASSPLSLSAEAEKKEGQKVESPPPTPPVVPPCNGVASVQPSSGGMASSESTPPSRTSDGKLILNQASAAELEALPGVGPKKAQAILDVRQKLGRFRKVSDLLRVRGVGHKTLKRWEPLLVVDPPPSSDPAPSAPPN